MTLMALIESDEAHFIGELHDLWEESSCDMECGHCGAVFEIVSNLLESDYLRVSRTTLQFLVDRADKADELEQELTRTNERLARRLRRIPIAIRLQVISRDSSCCRYCGADLTSGAIEIDHYEPDGPEELTNLVTACKTCNLKKRDTPPSKLKRLRWMQLLGKSPNEPPIQPQQRGAPLP